MYENSIANIILNGEEMKILPLKSRIRQGCSLILLLFNMVLEVPEQLDKKKIKHMQIAKEELKLSLFSDIMISYTENSRHFFKKLELIKEFSKTAGYKINVQKPVAFLYTNSELPRKEIRKTITF